MPMLTQPAFGPRTALIYVTAGALIDIWTAVYYFAFVDRTAPMSPLTGFWLAGLFLTGLTLIVIGLLLGPLGRSARKAELPPVEATAAEAQIQQTAAANPPANVQATQVPGVNGVVAQAPIAPAAPVMPVRAGH